MRLHPLSLLGRMKILKIPARGGKDSESQEQREQGRRCYILELPTELLCMIASHLPPLSEACLALTCKRFLAVSGAALLSESLHFNKDFAPLFYHYRNSQSFGTDRWKLLRMLENGKWRSCSKCLKLHPRSAFSSKELKRPPNTRTCNLGDFAGVVDLCPCKKLTFRDKLDLVDHLREREHLMELPTGVIGNRSRERYLWHSCTAIYGTTEIKIDIFPEIDEAGRLMVRTEYHMYVEPSRLGEHQHITPRFGCAHRSMDLWLSSVCQTLYCHRYDSFCAACKRISVCSTCETTLKCPRKRPYHCDETNKVAYFFWTQRYLGKSTTSPDKEWARQRIHPVESHVTWNNCRELCPWTIRVHPPPDQAPSLGAEILDPALESNSGGFANQVYSSLHL
ncbi:hypothetical protein VTN77DRAFT_7154 [Rasamsonia byssochlamydoides]|uniref:uncharacterized protein n=1 Tax=Rasamsonia byssochlamydoides TaxID=89139 RepID=UPI003743F046